MIEAKAISNNNCSIVTPEHHDQSPGTQIQRIKEELEDRLVQCVGPIVDEFCDRTGLGVRDIKIILAPSCDEGREDKTYYYNRAVIVPEV